MAIEKLRADFAIFDEIAYLNTGTCGPVPRGAARIAAAHVERQERDGRAGSYYGDLLAAAERLRSELASLIGADRAHVALTGGSSDGIGTVIAGLELGPGDEIVTADDEHPGLYGPLIDARAHRGVTVRTVALADVAAAVGPATKLVACSHVSWRSGQLAPLAALAQVSRSGVPVLLDGAQGLGAVRVNVDALAVDFYAGSGQKWLCGPVGTGMLWVSPTHVESLARPGLHYGSMVDQVRGLDGGPAPGAKRFDRPSIGDVDVALSLEALRVLGAYGWDTVFDEAARGAARLAQRLAAAGYDVVARDETTLVSWHAGSDAAAIALRDRLAARGIVIRDLPGTGGLVRASVGAYTNDRDIDLLLDALATAPAA